ncbi:putative fungal-specific transcription factor [Cryphonectria parasitica EP155]|uniref:Fungal-specific transcription factor n=1 Tax=Cryphonectria parasitica (strain ATCC 38755 / EP155) TaxID=660469 RepID=A0A9P4Y2B7_CRYP1|nr:putative fungal-specific transcription factor [Cryphonectria parasitica EP155]KAF3765266.1 putative fungal-specific transcription factor [Cryphonectria parasitica EP155]
MMALQPRVDNAQLEAIAGVTISLANQACATCKRQKRKCDKRLPACSRCASLQRACDYSDGAVAAAAPSAEDFAALQMKLMEIEARLKSAATGPGPFPDCQRQQQQTALTPTASSTNTGGSRSSSENNNSAAGPGTASAWTSDFARTMPPPPTNRFPAVFFLDIDVYYDGMTPPPRPTVDIPAEVLEMLDSSEVIEHAASVYFTTVHKWFSFISRKRMNLGISVLDGGPDLALLFLTMKLITTPPAPELASPADMPIYRIAKQFVALLESAGTVSLMYLQAMILIALYEYSHAIYPQAWMTVGNCVRYATMLSLSSYGQAAAILGSCKTWTEAEERRRTWWATHILDRLISLGNKRPFAGDPAPPPDAESLPVDDLAWDAGDMARCFQRPVSTPLSEASASPFARLAQAAVLISRAMAHCKRAVGRYNQYHGLEHICSGVGASAGDVGLADDGRPLNIREATAVVSELDTLCRAISRDMDTAGATPGTDMYFAYITAHCAAWSTAVMVLDMYACPEHMRPGAAVESSGSWPNGHPSRSEAEMAMQVEAINGLKLAGTKVRGVVVELVRLMRGDEDKGRHGPWGLGWTNYSAHGQLFDLGGGGEKEGDRASRGGARMVDRISPLLLDTVYCGMSIFQWLWSENGDPDMKEGFEIMKECVERIGQRWRLAGAYMDVQQRQTEALLRISSSTNGPG